MKKLVLLFVIAASTLLAGCMGTRGVVAGGDDFGLVGWDNRGGYAPGYGGYGHQARRGGRYTDPCQAYDASGLMGWATELEGGQQHQRNARMSVSQDGRVQCSSSEHASSRVGGVQRTGYRPVPQQYYQPQGQYRQAPMEPTIEGWQKPGWGQNWGR